jgi:hypothetical protein
VQVAGARAQSAAKRCTAATPVYLQAPQTLRDLDSTPLRTFNRIQGARGHLPSNHFLSEYSGAYGSHARMQPFWGSWGSLKTAGPYLATHSPAYNPALAQTASQQAFVPDPLMTTRLRARWR